MSVGAQCHSLATLPEKKSRTHCIGWDLELFWTAAEDLVQAGIQSPDSPACCVSLLLCRQNGSLEEKRGEGIEKSDRHHTTSPGFQVCFSDQTVTRTHTHTRAHKRTRARTHIHARAQMHTHPHTRAHTHAYARARAHTHKHAQTQS